MLSFFLLLLISLFIQSPPPGRVGYINIIQPSMDAPKPKPGPPPSPSFPYSSLLSSSSTSCGRWHSEIEQFRKEQIQTVRSRKRRRSNMDIWALRRVLILEGRNTRWWTMLSSRRIDTKWDRIRRKVDQIRRVSNPLDITPSHSSFSGKFGPRGHEQMEELGNVRLVADAVKAGEIEADPNVSD